MRRLLFAAAVLAVFAPGVSRGAPVQFILDDTQPNEFSAYANFTDLILDNPFYSAPSDTVALNLDIDTSTLQVQSVIDVRLESGNNFIELTSATSLTDNGNGTWTFIGQADVFVDGLINNVNSTLELIATPLGTNILNLRITADGSTTQPFQPFVNLAFTVKPDPGGGTSINPIPEPASGALWMAGLTVLGWAVRRSNTKREARA